MELLRYKKFYVNPKNGQAIGVVCRAETMSWGNVNLVEVATPGIGGMIMPQPVESPKAGWIEITADQFKELQRKYTMAAKFRRTGKGRVAEWLGKILRRKKKVQGNPVLTVSPNTSPKPVSSPVK